MGRVARRSWALLIIFLLIILTPLTALAYEVDATGWGANLPEKPHTWCQGCKTNPTVYDVNTSLAEGSGTTMGRAACGQFSMTALLVKSGVKPVGYAPWDYNKELKERHAAGKPTWATTGWVNWANIDDFTGGKLKFRKDLSMGGLGDGANANYANPPTRERIKELSSKYYMVILIPGHFVAVDRVEGDKTYIIDSAGTSATLEDMTHRSNSLVGVTVFEPGEGVPDAGAAMVLQTMTGGTQQAEQAQSGDIELSGGIISEDDLVGMPEKRNYMKDVPGAPVPDAITSENLTETEQEATAAQVDNLLTSVNDYKDSHAVDWLRTILSLMGLLLIFYAVLLVIAFYLDRSNPFFRVSFVKVLTFGQLQAATEEASEAGSAGLMTQKSLTLRVVITILLGVLLITGGMYSLAWWVYTELTNAISS